MYKEIYLDEFNYIVKDILEHDVFCMTKDKIHHGITRYDHLVRVSFYTYIVTKFLRLNYIDATRAALLHDFFLDEVNNISTIKALRTHPEYALKNAKKYFKINLIQEDIIKTHMFPVTFTPPKYLEGIIVDIIDDIAGIYEKYKSCCSEFKRIINFLFIFIVNFINK